jgi:hypothetical protein
MLAKGSPLPVYRASTEGSIIPVDIPEPDHFEPDDLKLARLGP